MRHGMFCLRMIRAEVGCVEPWNGVTTEVSTALQLRPPRRSGTPSRCGCRACVRPSVCTACRSPGPPTPRPRRQLFRHRTPSLSPAHPRRWAREPGREEVRAPRRALVQRLSLPSSRPRAQRQPPQHTGRAAGRETRQRGSHPISPRTPSRTVPERLKGGPQFARQDMCAFGNRDFLFIQQELELAQNCWPEEGVSPVLCGGAFSEGSDGEMRRRR